MDGRRQIQKPARCVLYHRGSVPDELVVTLTSRGVEAILCDNPYAALAELFSLDGGGEGEKRGGLILLLVEPGGLPGAESMVRVVERHAPRAVCWAYERGADPRLRAVVSKDVRPPHPPSSPPSPTQSPTHSSPLPHPNPVITRPSRPTAPAPMAGAEPKLRLTEDAPTDPRERLVLALDDEQERAERDTSKEGTGEGRGEEGGRNQGGGEDESAGGLLTEEELAMLLADDPPRGRQS